MVSRPNFQIPEWIFDVEEEDDINCDVPLATELEMDVAHTWEAVVSTFIRPFVNISAVDKEYETGKKLDHSSDFFGPLLSMGCFGGVSWLLSVKVLRSTISPNFQR